MYIKNFRRENLAGLGEYSLCRENFHNPANILKTLLAIKLVQFYTRSTKTSQVFHLEVNISNYKDIVHRLSAKSSVR